MVRPWGLLIHFFGKEAINDEMSSLKTNKIWEFLLMFPLVVKI